MGPFQVWIFAGGGVFVLYFFLLRYIKQHRHRMISASVVSVLVWTASITIVHYSQATGHLSWLILGGMTSITAMSFYLAAMPSFEPQDTVEEELNGHKSLDEDTHVD